MPNPAVLLVVLLTATLAFGQSEVAGPRLPDGVLAETAAVVTVTAVIDGDTVVLDDDRQVRLVGIQAPRLPLGRPGVVAWPGAAAARDHLARLVAGQRVRLAYAGNREDRYGRVLAHLVRQDGLWVQGALLAAGQARVYTFADAAAAAQPMLALERVARGQARGLWADPFYAVRTAGETADHLDSFQLIEGRVLDAQQVRGRVYLNFGEDWRSDFTVTVAPDDTDRFAAAGLDLLALAGRSVRVRGWLYWYNGPAVDLTHPDQLERLDP